MNRIRASALISALVVALAAPAPTAAGTPAAGVQQQIRSGLFVDVDMGGFFTLGGQNSRGQKRPSNAQVYSQLGLGYDLGRNLSVGASFGLGTSAASCFSTVKKRNPADPNEEGPCVFIDGTQKDQPISDNFTLTVFALTVSYKHHFTDRLTLQPRLDLGYASLDPEPVRNDQTGLPVTGGAVAGFALGLEYATHMDHFAIGGDISWRMVFGPNIMGFAFFPKIKYTF